MKVRVAIDQRDARILPDMGVRLYCLEGRPRNGAQEREGNNSASLVSGVVVPALAILQRNGRNVVFTIREGHARARPVTLCQEYGDLLVVTG